jgi:hypothetical protein
VQSSSQDIDQSIGVIDGTDTSMVDILGLVKGMGVEKKLTLIALG